jgi:UDPglucose 6-dehydrogenase
MKIAVIGTGYVGLVTGTCLAHKGGHDVTCIDIDEAKVAKMLQGEIPIYEPGLEEIYKDSLANKKLTVTTDLAAGIAGAGVIFLALPTPSDADGSADLTAVTKVADQLGPLLQRYTVVVDKSTVPVGTGEQVQERIAAGTQVDFDVVSNPEFLREGLAVKDFMEPDRIVVGAASDKAFDVMRMVYAKFVSDPAQLVCMDIKSAEMTKYAANSFLALKVSFMNEIANLCEKVGANTDNVRLGIGPDQRIGRQFLYAGIGFGGSCFPKDVLALHHTSTQNDYNFRLLNGIIDVNASQKRRLVEKVQQHYPSGVAGKRFALWGLAFKPDTDDVRDSPALEIIDELLQLGATVTAYDPHATETAKAKLGERSGLAYAPNALATCDGADALLIATEWNEFKQADLAKVKAALANPVVFDGRNIYDLETMQRNGFTYLSIGRPAVKPV